jgi:methionyl-tRNA formyltransferase
VVKSSPNILFIGGTLRGFELLKMLLEKKRSVVYACILKDDEHEARKVHSDMERTCLQHRIEHRTCKKIDPPLSEKLLSLKPDVAFVCGWRTLLPKILIDAIPQGCLAAHDSLLPRYRGFAPLNWAVINGEVETGVTLFRIGEGPVDSGDIFGQKKVEIGFTETATDVYPRIISSTLLLFDEYLGAMENPGGINFSKQDDRNATYACKRTPPDGKIDWSRSATEIYNLIRALSPPYPPAWTLCRRRKIHIPYASFPHRQFVYTGNIPGRVASISPEGVLILCGEGQILIRKIGDPLNGFAEAREHLNSLTITLGK